MSFPRKTLSKLEIEGDCGAGEAPPPATLSRRPSRCETEPEAPPPATVCSHHARAAIHTAARLRPSPPSVPSIPGILPRPPAGPRSAGARAGHPFPRPAPPSAPPSAVTPCSCLRVPRKGLMVTGGSLPPGAPLSRQQISLDPDSLDGSVKDFLSTDLSSP